MMSSRECGGPGISLLRFFAAFLWLLAVGGSRAALNTSNLSNSRGTPFRPLSVPTISLSSLAPPAEDIHWVLRLLPTLASYGTLLILGHLLIRWVQIAAKSNDRAFRRNCVLRFLRLFALGRPDYCLAPGSGLGPNSIAEVGQSKTEDDTSGSRASSRQARRRGLFADCVRVLFYFAGIQITLVCMGFFQERIVTRGYRLKEDPGGRMDFFRDAQFLVLANRLVALALSGLYLLFTWKNQPVHIPPFYLHSFASFSNVISSWCQYEALKYVSFPVQTVCKASKIVPTMLVGRLLRHQRYSSGQYLLALVLVSGASIFFLSMSSSPSSSSSSSILPHPPPNWVGHLQSNANTISGMILMCGYLLFDAFTPNWQKKLFDQPGSRISCSQMMFAVNVFSVLLCLVTLLQQWSLFSSIHFLLTHEHFLADCLLLSLGSACGQVFIYLTIQHFGPVVLAVLMTLRQIFSIILSSLYFVHPISITGASGLFLVFGTIFLDIYIKYSKNARRRRGSSGT